MKQLMIGASIIVFFLMLIWGAVALTLTVTRDVAPLSQDDAIALLARGKDGHRELSVADFVPGSLRIARRPQSHSAEIYAVFRSPSGMVRRGLVLTYVPRIVDGYEMPMQEGSK